MSAVIRVINGTESPVAVSLSFSVGGDCRLAVIQKHSEEEFEINPSVEGVPECIELIEPCLLACIQELDEPCQYTRLLAPGQVLFFPARIIVDGEKTPVSIKFERLAA